MNDLFTEDEARDDYLSCAVKCYDENHEAKISNLAAERDALLAEVERLQAQLAELRAVADYWLPRDVRRGLLVSGLLAIESP